MAGRCVTRGTDAVLVYYSAISSGQTEREEKGVSNKGARGTVSRSFEDRSTSRIDRD